MERIEVPFTDKQVNSFNEYQKEGQLHPFTCGNDDKTWMEAWVSHCKT